MLRGLSIVAGSAILTLLVAELLFRLLPVSTATMTGYHFDNDLLTYPAYHRWTVSTGWDLRNPQRLQSNNWGFPVSGDFLPDSAAIALIGDSYVESSMLEEAHRPPAQLQMQLGGGRRIYGLGSPGTALLDYAQRVRFAYRQLQVRDFVIWLEPGDARQALCGSGNVHSRCLDPGLLVPRIEKIPPPTRLKQAARHSALAQYIFGQLKVDSNRLFDALLRRDVPGEHGASAPGKPISDPDAGPPRVSQRSLQVVDAVLKEFFSEIDAYRGGRFLFVVDGRRSGFSAAPSELDLERYYLIERLRAYGAEVIDLEPLFAEHSARSSQSLEVGPFDRHLNPLGVRLATSQVAITLRGDKPVL